MKRSVRASSIAFMMTLSFLAAQDVLASGAADSANQASGISLSTIVPSVAVGTALVAPCHAPGGQATCIPMALAFAQAAASLINGNNSKSSAAGLSSLSRSEGAGSAASTPAPLDYSGLTRTSNEADVKALTNAGLGSLVSDYSTLKAAVAGSGVTLSPDGSTVTLPNGKTVPSSAFSSDSAMKNAGFSAGDISAFDNAMKGVPAKIEAAKSKVASMTNDQGGGGGGGMGSGGGGGGSGSSDGGGSFNPFALRGGKRANTGANLAGMSKKLGSDSIGVSGDDIFEMITRRYQARDKADGFLKK